MNDSKLFDEISSRFLTGLTADQLAGKEDFSVSEQLASMRISSQSRFDAKAEEILESADKSSKASDTPAMNDISREEINVKLQLVEERIDRKVSDIAASVDSIKSSNKSTVDALNSAKWWAIGTAIAVLAIFIGTLQWGLSAQKEENARFSSYIRDDVKSIADDVKDVSKSVTEMRIKLESQQPSKP